MPYLRNRKRGAADVEADEDAVPESRPAPVACASTSAEQNGDPIREEDLSLLSWLEFHQKETESFADILKDEINTIKKRKIVGNLKVLENEQRPEAVRLSKSIVIGFNDAIAKAVKNLTNLGQTMVEELQQRYNLSEKWLETASAVTSVAGSEITGPTFSRKYLQNKFLSSLDDGSRSSDISDAKNNEEKDGATSNESDEQADVNEPADITQVEQLDVSSKLDDDDCTTSGDKTPPVPNGDVSMERSLEEDVVNRVPASDDEDSSSTKEHESVSTKISSSTEKVISVAKIKKEKLDASSSRIDTTQSEQLKADSGSIFSKNQLLKVAKMEAMDDSGSDSDGSGKTCVVPRHNLSQSEKFNHLATPKSPAARVKKEPLEKPAESPEKNKKINKQSSKKVDTPKKGSKSIVERDDSMELEQADPVGEADPQSGTVPPDASCSVNGLDDMLPGPDNDIMDFFSLPPDLDETGTVVVPRSSENRIQEQPTDVQKAAETILEGDRLCNGDIQAVNPKDNKNQKRQETLSKEEAKAMKEVLDSSDSDNPRNNRRREAHKKTEKVKPSSQSDQNPENGDKSWKDDPKLNKLKSVVELEKLDPSVQKTLNENKFVCLKTYEKMKKSNLDVLENNDSFSDDDSEQSDDSIVKLEKALKSLTRGCMIRSKRYKQNKLLQKSGKKSKRKSGNESGSESLMDDDEDDDDDCNDVNVKVRKQSSFKKFENDLKSCSESDDFSPGADSDKETINKKAQSSKTRAAATKKKYARVAIDNSSSDSEGADKKCVLGSDSDEDSDKKKSSKKSKSRAKSSDSDSSDFTVVKTKKASKRAKKKGSDSDVSVVELSDQSDDDSDFKTPRPKGFRSASKRNRDSSPEGGKKKKRRRKRIINDSDDSDKKESNDSDIQEVSGDDDDEQGSSQKGRKNIRKIMSNKKLAKTTREAEKDEEERRKRIQDRQDRQNLFNGIHKAPESDKLERLVLESDPLTEKPIIEVDPTIVRHLKPHQAQGIKFMYDACFESVEMIKQNKVPGGCILAHCMGLGKTLQSVAFIHTLLTNKITGIKTALVICPLSTVNNWYNEFKNWTEDADDIRLHKLYEAKNTAGSRMDYLKTWQRRGGVGILHYDMFRMLADPKGKKKMKDSFRKLIKEALLDEPGPDIVVCDEGHLLKNCKSMLSLAVSNIGTHRRIVLTGTPLQNNLVEYHTMMNFVKPNLLGTLNEFTNRFVNPIKNGQHADSTDSDVKTMKRRAHVLHGKLEGCVQRCDYLILAPYLPPKYEYIINIKLSDKQELLYKHYLENVVDGDLTVRRKNLLKYYAELVKIWSHPIALTISRNKTDDYETSEDEAGSLKDFVVDESEEECSKSSDSGAGTGDEKATRKTRAQAAIDPDPPLPDVSEVERLSDKWWNAIFKTKSEMTDVEISGKLVVLQQILKTCESIGDKVLVFSQYLSSLDIIEEFLVDWDKEAVEKAKDADLTFPLNGENSRWRRNIEYFRIDGQTKVSDRHRDCETFNKKSGQMTRAKLFLISTRAGGLGINLFGANRVVIFDASWNPSQDMQSIFRVYRFGQDKPCYIYRLIARGTMEEKILRRQITKLSLASRVVDEHQIERHFKFDDVNEMYRYDEEDPSAAQKLQDVPKDRLLADLLMSHGEWIRSYEPFDSLLENKPDEGLSVDEKRLAWEEYRRESDRRQNPSSGPENAETFLKVKDRLVEKYPTATEIQLRVAADLGLVVIDKVRAIMMQVNQIQEGRIVGDANGIMNTYLNPLKAWLADFLTPPPPGTPLPQIDETTPLAKPLPFQLDAYNPNFRPMQQQFQQYPMQYGRPPVVQRRNVSQMQYPRPNLPSMNEMQNNFRNIAANTLNGPPPMGRAWNMIRPQSIPRQLPRDPLQ